MSLEDEERFKVMSTKDFKNMVKEKVRLAAYKDLEVKKSSHEKVKDIVHFNLNHSQKYLTESRLDNNEKQCYIISEARVKTNLNTTFQTDIHKTIAKCVAKPLTYKNMLCHVKKQHIR